VQLQLLQLLAEAAQTPQRLVLLSGELELLELETSNASKTAWPAAGSIEVIALNSQCKATARQVLISCANGPAFALRPCAIDGLLLNPGIRRAFAAEPTLERTVR